MNIILWVLLILMTLIAWGFIAIPLWKYATEPGTQAVKGLLLGFPLVALGLYACFGNSHQLQAYWIAQQQEQLVQQRMADIKDPQQLIQQLQAHLQQTPQAAQGWYLLGRLYLSVQQYVNAEAAFDKAVQLQPDNSDYLIGLAKANLLNYHGRLSPAIEAALKKVLKSASSLEVLNLLAVDAYQRKAFHQAVQYWQQALALVQPDSPDSRTLLTMISQAQQQGENNGR